MEFEMKDVTIGALVLAALAVFLGVFVAINRERFSEQTYALEIRLPNIAGIDKGVEVVYKGYKAGRVDRVTIAYEPEFRFIVRLLVKREIQLRVGTTVSVKNKGFGGARYLELNPPADDGSRTMLPEDSVLPVKPETDLMTKANEVMDEVQKFVKELQKANPAQEIRETVTHARSAVVNLDQTLATLNAMLKENRESLKLTTGHTESLTGRSNELLKREDAAITASLENLNASMTHLPSILKNLEELTDDVKRHPWRLLRKGDEGPSTKVEHDHPAVQKSTATVPAISR